MTKKGEIKDNEAINSQDDEAATAAATPDEVKAVDPDLEAALADEVDPEETVMAIITQLGNEVSEAKESLLRKVAEFENFKKRTAKEKDDLYSYTVSTTVAAMLPALDSFELALKTDSTDESFKKGCELIYNQFIEQLTRLGVTEMSCVGEKFSPEQHNAVLHIEDESYGENEVVEVLLKGYMHGERVVRHAMVKVAN